MADGPVVIEHFDHPSGSAYQVRCEDCGMIYPYRFHRIDAEDDFDNHRH